MRAEPLTVWASRNSAGDQLLGRRVALEPEQALAHRRKPFVDLRAERCDELGVVGPAVHDTRNCSMDERSSAASTLSSAAAAADCFEPTAYCRETSDTWVIADTT